MPSPQQPPAESSQPQHQPPNQQAATGKSNSRTMVIAIGAVALILVLAIGGVLLAHANGKQTAAAPSAPGASTPLGSAAFYTNRLTLDTPTSTVDIIEVRQKDARRCVEAFYHATGKRTQLELSITGSDTYAKEANGDLGDFLGWTFKNADYTYFVSAAGHLLVTQGTKKLVSENGTWTEQNYQLRPSDR